MMNKKCLNGVKTTSVTMTSDYVGNHYSFRIKNQAEEVILETKIVFNVFTINIQSCMINIFQEIYRT